MFHGKKKGIFKQLNIWYLIFSILFSSMIIISKHVFFSDYGDSTIENSYVTDFHMIDIFILLLLSIFIYNLLQLLVYLITVASISIITSKRKASLLLFLGMTAVLFISWIPYLMSYWPGGIYADTVDTLDMALKKKPLTNHNPILYTLLWRFVFYITGAFSGNGEYAGLKLFTILQTLVLALSLAGFVYYCYRIGIHKKIILLLLIFFAIFPLYPFYGISMWKDTLFCIVLFLLCLFLYDSFITNDGELNWARISIYTILSIFTIFLRNNGIFIIIFSSILTTLICFKKLHHTALKIGISSIIVILLSLFIQGPIYNQKGYNEDSNIESLGIPLQQTAYILTTGGIVDENDYETLSKIMPIEQWTTLYNPTVVDPIKFAPSFQKDYFIKNSNLFMQSYLHLIINNPEKAIKAYLLATLGFWDIYENSPVAYICNFHFPNANYFMSDYFDATFHISFRNFAEPKTFISPAIFAWILIGVFCICLSKKNYTSLIPLLPSLGLWLTIMIATPIAFSFRYVYSLFLCTPLYLFILFSICKKNNNTNKQ